MDGSSSLAFLGYRVKGTPPAMQLPGLGKVREVCSMADCLRSGPEGEPVWDGLNAASCYRTEALARASARGARGFSVYAYRLMPSLMRGVEVEKMDVQGWFGRGAGLPMDEPGTEFERAGFDAVGVVLAASVQDQIGPVFMCWGCSPLSCNGLAERYPVNEWCLLDRLDDAVKAARDFAREEPEPGPYVVVEVLRMREEAR